MSRMSATPDFLQRFRGHGRNGHRNIRQGLVTSLRANDDDIAVIDIRRGDKIGILFRGRRVLGRSSGWRKGHRPRQCSEGALVA